MDDLLFMYIVKPLAYLTHNRAYISFVHSSIFSQHFKELTISTKFNKQIYIFFILKVPVKRSNVAVVQKELNTQLSSYLILIFLKFDLAFIHHFHSTNKTSLLVLN